MYTPTHFAESRIEVLHGLIEAHPLATIVTTCRDGPAANHVPLELDPAAGALGTLAGHVARTNPIWTEHDPACPVLVIFQGPQAYISPAYYPSKHDDPRVVPTWNYAVVHARGFARMIEDRDWLRALVLRLTDRHEAARTDPWAVSDAPAAYIDRMLRAIVGFEIPIERIEGKWKMSQNKSRADRDGVVAGLRVASGEGSTAAADVIAQQRLE